ncbi:hypothetical protein F5Y07DRAFT_394685 [Xylaria sp. FL0933]|nr:hypothetical protein F5Y07DRAFT_394685 [Xylaria sp. FL0933]
MKRKDRTQMSRTNVLETVDATVQFKERWPSKYKFNGPPELPKRFRVSKTVERCLDALQVLQMGRDEYLLEYALAVPLQFLHDSLPYMVKRDVNIFLPVQRDIWSLELGGDFDRLDAELGDFIERHEEELSSKRYHFWPIDISRGGEDDPPRWALIVLHLTHKNENGDDSLMSKDTQKKPYNFLYAFAVIDPEHGNAARELEDEVITVLKHVSPKMGITYVTVNPPHFTITGEKENWSSGLRVFEMIRVWLDRITEHYCDNPHDHDEAKFWGAHPGWFNVDAIRSNMIGMAATMVNRAMKSTTRIAIEPILDNSMRHTIDDRAVTTQTMLPDRQCVGAFMPNQSRKHPYWINDTPVDRQNADDDAEETGTDSSEDSNEEAEIEVTAGREKKEAKKKSVEKKTTEKKTAEKKKKSAEKESAEKESGEKESADKKKTTEKKSAEKKTTKGKSTEKESTGEKSTEKESTEKESAEKKKESGKKSAKKRAAEPSEPPRSGRPRREIKKPKRYGAE